MLSVVWHIGRLTGLFGATRGLYRLLISIFVGTLPLFLLLLVLFAILLRLENVVHEVIEVLIIHLFVGVVELFGLSRSFSAPLTLVSFVIAPLLLTIPLSIFARV